MAKAIHTMIRVLDETRSVGFYRAAFAIEPAARLDFDTFTRSESGTYTASLYSRGLSRGRSGSALAIPSRLHSESLIPPAQLSNAVCGE